MPLPTIEPSPDHDDVDDVDLHSVNCNCDDCVEGLILELFEERAS
jgi:hypothetical protein